MTASPTKITRAVIPSPAPHISTLAITLLVMALVTPVLLRAGPKQLGSALLTVHEWGTFTSVAGSDGTATVWLPPLTSDLPAFVERYRGAYSKASLAGTIRMETPVMYFYAPRETTVSVRVSFSKGLITEWYPHASRVSPTDPPRSNLLPMQLPPDGSITWNSVKVSPNQSPDFPQGNFASHYYTARQTSATPLLVKTPSGDQNEKFLFYRGVSRASIPLSAKVLPDGRLQVENLTTAPVPALILFERRDDNVGYQIVESLQNHVNLETPPLTGNLDSLRGDFERTLIGQGLYLDEARAMLETWRDSWFEEGSRLFYIVPRSFVASVLPLSIDPAPAQLARVFVGRLEILSPQTQSSIEAALAAHDSRTLQKYGRFLEPFFNMIVSMQSNPSHVAHFRRELDGFYNSQAQ